MKVIKNNLGLLLLIGTTISTVQVIRKQPTGWVIKAGIDVLFAVLNYNNYKRHPSWSNRLLLLSNLIYFTSHIAGFLAWT